MGTKNPASTHEGVKAGLRLQPDKLVFSLIRPMARPSPASHDAGLDECEQAGLLASRSFYFAGLTDVEHQWLIGISSLVTAALPRGIWSEDHTRFPILPKPWFEALAHIATHNQLWVDSKNCTAYRFPTVGMSRRHRDYFQPKHEFERIETRSVTRIS